MPRAARARGRWFLREGCRQPRARARQPPGAHRNRNLLDPGQAAAAAAAAAVPCAAGGRVSRERRDGGDRDGSRGWVCVVWIGKAMRTSTPRRTFTSEGSRLPMMMARPPVAALASPGRPARADTPTHNHAHAHAQTLWNHRAHMAGPVRCRRGAAGGRGWHVRTILNRAKAGVVDSQRRRHGKGWAVLHPALCALPSIQGHVHVVVGVLRPPPGGRTFCGGGAGRWVGWLRRPASELAGPAQTAAAVARWSCSASRKATNEVYFEPWKTHSLVCRGRVGCQGAVWRPKDADALRGRSTQADRWPRALKR